MPFTLGDTVAVALSIGADVIATGNLFIKGIRPGPADANDTSNPIMLEIVGVTTGSWTVDIS